jgi:pimeloyl-ACP methyl ester carboxylesterase
MTSLTIVSLTLPRRTLAAAALLELAACASGFGALAKSPAAKPPIRVATGGIEFEVDARGDGDPVVLIHGGVFADWYGPLLSEPALGTRYRLVTYRRAGYGASTRVAGPLSIAQQAGQLRALMGQLRITRAHVVGHSSGGNIALQLALDAPETVQSLSLLEPALSITPAAGSTAAPPRNAAMSAVLDAYRAGRKDVAVDGFLQIVAGPHYRPVIDRALPGWHAQALADADTFFGQELPAVQQWPFKREDAARITQPVLAVIGERSAALSPVWTQRQQQMLTWWPHAEPFVLPRATHLLPAQNPRDLAAALAAFFARHPIAAR